MQAALAAFKKLHAMLPDNYDVLWQLANCYDIMGDFRQAVKWLEMLSSLVPNDPGVLAKLGAIHARFDDEPRALHYYQVRALSVQGVGRRGAWCRVHRGRCRLPCRWGSPKVHAHSCMCTRPQPPARGRGLPALLSSATATS